MAILDVLSSSTFVMSFSRGDIGIVSDSVAAEHSLILSIPVEADVRSGTVFGAQNSDTGSLSGGGGSGGYSRGRIVNA